MRFLTIALFFLGFSISAQTFTYYVTDYRNGSPSAMVGVPGDQFKSILTITNPSSGTIYLHVKRTQKSIPLYWSQWFHYIQPCSPSQDTISIKVLPFSSTPVTIHLKTDSVKPGVATSSFKIYRTGFEDEAETFNLTASTKSDVGLRTEMKPGDIRIFPNPANRFLNITSIEKKTTNITVCDALGLEKFNAEKVVLPLSVDLSEYPAGVYFVKVTYGNTAYVEKIIKN